MPVYFDRYDRSSKGIAAFLLSPQLNAAIKSAAQDVKGLAQINGSQHIAKDYKVTPGEPAVINKTPRVTQLVVNDNEAAAANEFGSGKLAEGPSAGQPRPQGGYSPAKRDLARAGQMIGDLRGEVG